MNLKRFIGKKIRLERVELTGETSLHNLLDYYMGKNTPERQDFIISNLKMEEELIVAPDQSIEAVAETEAVEIA
jgi:topoisomerase-4 subunit B